MPRPKPLVHHILPLAGILILTAIVYAKLPQSYFCAYDDFLEVHRAAFEDTRDPRRVFTTTHFTSYKYRPLNRGINLITYWAGEGSAHYFRTRNVICHLINVVFVYLLSWMLFRNRWLSIIGALLFGIHPLANHAIVGAVMTNSAAHSMFLFALLMFVWSTKKNGLTSVMALFVALFAGWLSLLTYEAAIVLYPLLFGYLAIQYLATRKWPVSKSYTLYLLFGSIFFWTIYYLLHAKFVPYSAKRAVPSVSLMIKNLLTYAVATVLPVDPVLANAWFGTPLPSDVDIHGRAITLLLGIIGLGGVLLIGFLLLKFKRQMIDRTWPAQLFVLMAAASAIAPLIVFTDKPSETYLYLTIAFVAILFASFAVQLLKPETNLRGRAIVIAVVGLLSISYALGTWVRNDKVHRCGETAHQIASGLDEQRFKSGTWFVYLMPAPGEPQSHRYGMYGWRGIDTVGTSALQEALQLVNRNENVIARVLAPEEVSKVCNSSHYICLEVHDDGRVDQLISPAAATR